MKQFYFLLIALGLSCFSNAQTKEASKIYGYKQPVLPGTIRTDDNGKPMPRKQQFNYFFYIVSSSKINPLEIWINGEADSVTAINISSPVQYKNPTSLENKSKTLVPKTSKKVLQLNASGKKVEKPTQKGKLLSTKNELVIIYSCNGKLYYKAISKLNELEPVAMQ